MLGALGNNRHQVGAGPDILSGHVRAAQTFHGIAKVQHGVPRALGSERRADRDLDDSFAASAIQTGRSILERHRHGKAQSVCDRIRPIFVLPEPRSTQCLTESGRMHGNADSQTGPLPGGDQDSLVGERLSEKRIAGHDGQLLGNFGLVGTLGGAMVGTNQES